MDAKTKQAWKYIKELNYYSKKWGEPLAKLIDTLIGNMLIPVVAFIITIIQFFND